LPDPEIFIRSVPFFINSFYNFLAEFSLADLCSRRVGSVEVSSSRNNQQQLLEATPEADLEARLAKEAKRLADMEKELKLEIQMKVRHQCSTVMFSYFVQSCITLGRLRRFRLKNFFSSKRNGIRFVLFSLAQAYDFQFFASNRNKRKTAFFRFEAKSFSLHFRFVSLRTENERRTLVVGDILRSRRNGRYGTYAQPEQSRRVILPSWRHRSCVI
jgi:hypothetical protein